MTSETDRSESGGASRQNKIQPASVTLSGAEPARSPGKTGWLGELREGAGSLGWPAAAGAAVLAVLVLVILFIPGRNGQENVVATTSEPAAEAVIEEAAAPPPPAGESPFEAAQAMRARRASQDLLATLLDRQEELEALSVDVWALEAYEDALALAEVGDSHYRNRDFPAAQASYEEALAAADALVERSQEVLAEALQDGSDALGNLDSEAAKTAFELALLIDPVNADAQAGLTRSGVIDQVTEELIEVDRLIANDQLAEARDLVVKLQGVDPLDPRLPPRLTKLTTTLRDQNYVAAMSRGYSSMQQGDFTGAIAAFRQALTIKPGAPDAQQAIDDAQNLSVQSQVSGIISDAQRAEEAEDWYTALESYKAILAIEEKSVLGVTGRVRVEARWKLDQQLESILGDPDSILDPAVIGRATQLHADALALTNRGPRIDRQTAELGRMLQAVREPVTIELVSDGETDVTLLKHGQLGKFLSQEITVKPGKYVAVGQRNGYRDVRVDILVRADSQAQPFTVQCDEPIFKRS